jgi:hypothetical protein
LGRCAGGEGKGECAARLGLDWAAHCLAPIPGVHTWRRRSGAGVGSQGAEAAKRTCM